MGKFLRGNKVNIKSYVAKPKQIKTKSSAAKKPAGRKPVAKKVVSYKANKKLQVELFCET